MTRRSGLVLAVSLAVAATTISCHSSAHSPLDDMGKSVDVPDGPTKSKDGAPKKHDPDAPPPRAAVTSASLAPIIKELGVEGVDPTAISISFAAQIIDRNDIGNTAGKSVLKITPDIKGTLAYAGASELAFTPAKPFEFDTTYKVELQKVETRDGVLDTAATYEFKTPAFKFLSMAPSEVDVTKHTVVMNVVFSGTVLPNKALSALAFTIDGKATTLPTLLPSHTGNELLVKIEDPRIAVGAKLGLAVSPALTSYTGATHAPAATASYTIGNDEAIAIKTVAVVEGGTGYYLEVVCNDAAAAPGERSYYGDESYDNLSQRCQLTDESLAKIHITPAVPKLYLTSGRSGFRIFGQFKRGAYSLKIDSGARSIDGGIVLAPYARSFTVAARKPQLSFASSGRYLPRSAWTNLGIKHLNMDGVTLVVRQVPPENLVFWMGNPGSDAADERTSNVILRKTISLRGDPDAQTMSWLDLGSLLPATTKGVLELKLVGVGSTATSRLLVTNLSLVAKKTSTPGKPWEQQVQVWALDMETAQLVDGVDVSLVRKSGKTVATCETSGNDGCHLGTIAGADPDEAEPFALVAKKGDDLTYLRYQDLRADVTESSTSGVAIATEQAYRAAMFSDRGVYRPGETAHVTAIVRDQKNKAPDSELPVEVSVYDPKAKLVRKQTLKTNAGGVIALDQAFPQFADTGHWRVDLTVADKVIAGYDVQVEEFVPERMKVEATPKATDVLAGAALDVHVAAQYLFGGTAADSGVELACTVASQRFAPEENGDLTYGVEPHGKDLNLETGKGQLDPKGEVDVACTTPDGAAPFSQTSVVTATASVLEAGSGRATVKTTHITVHPEKYYLGLRTKETRASEGKTFTVEGTVVDWKGKPDTASVKEVQIDLAHLEADYGYGYDEYSGESRYDRNLRHVPEGKLTAKVDGGHFKFDVTPNETDAGYMVTVTAGKAKTELLLDGEYPYEYYGYYEGGYGDTTPRPAKPTKLAVQVPKEIEVGKATDVKVRAPYAGRVLWTVEADHVIKSEWKDASPGENTWSFTLGDYAPNVYVSAFVVKDPHLESKAAFIPDRAFGIGSSRVKPVEFTQGLTIDAPKEVRSSANLNVTLQLDKPQGPTFAVVAVVDEGILSLTNFQTPDPLATLFAKRALGVETYETIGWTMLHQPAGASSKTGGGDGGMGEDEQGALGQSRVQPVKPVALFSGVLKVPDDGKLVVPFTLPSYRGQVRVMAITSGASKVGRAEAKVTVKDPLVIQTTFPRFVTQGDELQVPVFLTNMSGGPLVVDVQMDSAALVVAGLAAPKKPVAPLTFSGKNTTQIKLENGRNEAIVFQAKANLTAGGAKITVVAHAKGGAGAFDEKDELEVPFLPNGPKEKVIAKLKVPAGVTDLAAQAALKGWAPTSEKTTFWLTTNPYGEVFDHLKYLIHYPYGCIEQTVSSTRPLLYVGNIVEEIDPQLAAAKIEDMVLAGINRVWSMETPSGGFGYWPGATEPLEWATAYATHMLLDAKKEGYAISDERLAGALAWIENRVSAYERGAKIQRQPWNHYDEQSEAYLHFVLAKAGKGNKARILKLVGDIPATATGEQAEDRYMLMAALYMAGDRRFEKELKAVDVSPINAKDRVNSWSFYSDRRRRAFMLATFHDLFGNDPAGEPLATRVAESLSTEPSWYYNTQELVWGVTGLGKWVATSAAKGTPDGTLTADGTVITARKSNKHPGSGANDKTWALLRASEYGKLTLDVPASSAGMWLVVSSEGVRETAQYKEGSEGLKVARTYRDSTGAEVNLTDGSLKLGDLVFVEDEITNSSGNAIQNIALVDRLPAGFEIENPRLGRTTKADWFKPEDLWDADFMNMRDDHVEYFGSLPANTSKTVIYTVRIVTAGKFTIPPIDAEAMYDATLWGREKGGQLVVSGPWTGKTI